MTYSAICMRLLIIFCSSFAAGNTLLRRLLVSVPYSWRRSPAEVYTVIAHYAADGTLQRVYHDIDGRLGFVSSLEQCGGALYGGVLSRDFVVKVDLA